MIANPVLTAAVTFGAAICSTLVFAYNAMRACSSASFSTFSEARVTAMASLMTSSSLWGAFYYFSHSS